MATGGRGWRDLGLALVFLLAVLGIAGKSYFDPEGGLFEDSTQYLKLSQSLVDGRGWATTPCNFESDRESIFFAIWPVGYPLLVAGLALLTGLNVYLASKALAILLVGLLILAFRKWFGRADLACACTLLLAPFLEIFSVTMSEVPFIAALVGFCLTAVAFLKRPSAPLMAALALMAALVFLFRYIGIFTVGVCGLLALHFLMKRQYRPMALALGAATLAGLLALAYLANNYLQTGHLTGMVRNPNMEPWQGRLAALSGTLLFMLNPMMIKTLGPVDALHWALFGGTLLLEAALVAWIILRARAHRAASPRSPDTLEGILFLVGAVDWAAVTVLHWISNIDLFSNRLFAPGALLFLLGGIHYLQRVYPPPVFRAAAQAVAVMAIAAYGLHVPLKVYKNSILDGEPTYAENMRTLEARYRSIPPGSAVIVASAHINYLRPDLRILYPCFGPLRMDGEVRFHAETYEELVRRAARMSYPGIFVDVQETLLNTGRVDVTFRAIAENHLSEAFIRVR